MTNQIRTTSSYPVPTLFSSVIKPSHDRLKMAQYLSPNKITKLNRRKILTVIYVVKSKGKQFRLKWDSNPCLLPVLYQLSYQANWELVIL